MPTFWHQNIATLHVLLFWKSTPEVGLWIVTVSFMLSCPQLVCCRSLRWRSSTLWAPPAARRAPLLSAAPPDSNLQPAGAWDVPGVEVGEGGSPLDTPRCPAPRGVALCSQWGPPVSVPKKPPETLKMDPLQNNGEEDSQCAEEEEEEVDPRIQVRLCFSSPNRSRCCHQWKWHWGEHVEPNDKKVSGCVE